MNLGLFQRWHNLVRGADSINFKVRKRTLGVPGGWRLLLVPGPNGLPHNPILFPMKHQLPGTGSLCVSARVLRLEKF